MTTGDDVVVAGAKLRALLAVLALHVGRVVPAEQLVDALWGEDPPAAVRNGLQGLASKLRRALGSADLVVDARRRLRARAAAGRRSTSTGSSSCVADGRAAAADGDLERAVDAAGRGRLAVAGRSARRLRLRGLRRRRRSPGCPSCGSP